MLLIRKLFFYGLERWIISKWLSKGSRIPWLVVIDAKGLWTKIQNKWKTEKHSTIYVRRMMEILFRIGARVYWVNSGHMLADGMTKLGTKSPPPNLDLLLHVLETNDVRITYCEGSWRKELQSRSAGKLEELPLLNPLSWSPPEDTDYDTKGRILPQ